MLDLKYRPLIKAGIKIHFGRKGYHNVSIGWGSYPARSFHVMAKTSVLSPSLAKLYWSFTCHGERAIPASKTARLDNWQVTRGSMKVS